MRVSDTDFKSKEFFKNLDQPSDVPGKVGAKGASQEELDVGPPRSNLLLRHVPLLERERLELGRVRTVHPVATKLENDPVDQPLELGLLQKIPAVQEQLAHAKEPVPPRMNTGLRYKLAQKSTKITTNITSTTRTTRLQTQPLTNSTRGDHPIAGEEANHFCKGGGWG